MSTPARWNPTRCRNCFAFFFSFTLGLPWVSVGVAAQAGSSVEQVGGTHPDVLTTFEQVWQLSEAAQKEWHRVRFDYEVYYYDPLWKALWGRSGGVENYLSLGLKSFPIKVGQRIRIEGRIQPTRGMLVEDPAVTVLADSVPLDVLSTTGDIGNAQRFNKRLVKTEGFVDRQLIRDANHLELHLIVEGRVLLVQLLLQSDAPVPQLQGSIVEAKGVYFMRTDGSGATPKIEIWVQQLSDLSVRGALDQDPRFAAAEVDDAALATMGENAFVRITGVVKGRTSGKTLTVRTGSREISVQTPQTSAIEAGDKVDVIGVPDTSTGAFALRHALYRRSQKIYTSVAELWDLPEAERLQSHPVRFDVLVYYFDAHWKALWGQIDGRGDYLSLGTKSFPIKPGQRIRVEGTVCPANGMTVADPRVTVLEESVALPAADTRGDVGNSDRFNKTVVVVEGLVDRQVVTDKLHTEIDLVVDGRVVVGRLLVEDDVSVPNFEGALLRMTGVYSATIDPTGALPAVEIWISGLHRIQALGTLTTDERFSVPAIPIEKLPQVGPTQLVRVEGLVRTQQPGKSLAVRDETGQVNLFSAQTRSVAVGQRIEAIGYPTFEGGEWGLRDVLYRRAQTAPPAPTTGLPKLRLADQLRELAPEEAERSYPVQLSGVITWARPNADFIYVRDVSGGVCVIRPPGFTGSLLVGTKVELTGVSGPGKFTPVVLANQIQSFASVDLPEARPVTLEQALTGIEEAQWVTMSGYVRSVATDGPWTRLDLTTSGGEFQAMMPLNDRWAKLPGSVVRVKGVVRATANEKRQLTGIQVWVPSSRFLDLEEPAPEAPFSVAARPIASLRRFSSLEALNRRVRVSGVVVRHVPGRLVDLQDGSEGLMVLSRDTVPLSPGDRIEAVGFPGRENSRLVLREAVYRKVADGLEPTAIAVNSLRPIDAERDGLLVKVVATLVDSASQENGTRLMLQTDGVYFEAAYERAKDEVTKHWIPGSRLELTGVYRIEFDEYKRPDAISLQLRSAGDVRVLQRPSGLTAGRVMIVAGVLAVCVVLGCGWVLALRRRVRHQTGVIRDQLEKEKAARLDAALARASKLESVGVLAGGIAHDFNNLLTVIVGNLSLAKLDPQIESETVRCLNESEKAAVRAKDLTQQLLTFSKGGDPVRASAQLPEIVREATQFGLHGSSVRSEFQIAPDLWAAEVDKGQIAQVIHNLIINASQAMPSGGMIKIGMSNDAIEANARPELAAGRYIRVRIVDTGQGIPAENLTRIFDPYFTTKPQGSGLGLATVYSIIKKHGGHIDVQSSVGVGTTFTIWLPAALKAAADSAVSTNATAAKAGRVLIMDDELSIRRLGSAVIKRMGFEVTAVNDGAAVVNEYASATAAGRPYDLVILDLTVPGGMGGAEAMEKLRDMDRDVRAIVSSGYSSDPVMANHLRYGFCARVPKPYTASDLITVVKTVMKPAMT